MPPASKRARSSRSLTSRSMRSPSSWITLTARCPSFDGGMNCGSAERLGVAANRRQRRHQLVRDVGEQLTPRAVGLDELRLPRRKIGGHAIERVGDRRHFVAADCRRAGGEIALAKPPRRLLDARSTAPGPGGRSPARRPPCRQSAAASRRSRAACRSSSATRCSPVSGGTHTTATT